MKFTRNISQYARSKRGRLAAGIAMLALGLAVIGGVAPVLRFGPIRFGAARRLERIGAGACRASRRRVGSAADTPAR